MAEATVLPVPAAVRIVGDAAKAGSFAVPSLSMPGHIWYVEWQNGAVRWCGCPRFQRATECRHTDAVGALIHDEARAIPFDPKRAALADERIREMQRVFDR